MRIAVVGAGIGGAAAGIALARAGHDVVVCERAERPGEVGAGIVLWGNAVAALRRIGAADAVLAHASRMGSGELRSARGRLLASQDLRIWDAELGAPSVVIHRSRLLDALLGVLGPERVRFGRECVGVEALDGGARVRFSAGNAEDADVVVGADGLRSLVRAHLHGDAAPRYAGYTCWRAVARVPRSLVDDGTFCETWGRGARFGWLRLPDESVYWFATVDAPPGGRDASDADALARLAALYGAWWGPIPELIRATRPEHLLRNDILDRPPRDARWGCGRITLLGDAAHATTPNIGQGACLAIEDGVSLADHLASGPDVAASLRAYERERHRRTAWIVRFSWRLGAVAQWRAPLACALRDASLALTPGWALRLQHRRVVGHRV
jgi:2-polyprenyl-6-methoxyphenol hydroxylase-like FAD-dependent oxidoreductase